MKRVVLNFLLVATLTVSAAFTSCNKEPEAITVNLITNINLEENDRVGLYMKKAGQALTDYGAVYSNADNLQMSIQDQALVADPPVNYPAAGNVDFFAYYPYTALVHNDFTIDVNVVGQEEGLPIEVLRSVNANNKQPTVLPVSLEFLYSLARFEITVTASENNPLTPFDFLGMTANIDGMYTYAKLQLIDGVFVNHPAKQPITLYKKSITFTSATFEALVLPITEADGEITFTFNIGGNICQYKQKANYFSNYLYKLDFTLGFQTANLTNTVPYPRQEYQPQNNPVNAASAITMTSEASELRFDIAGTGKMLIDWGDGMPHEIHTLSSHSKPYTYEYAHIANRTIRIIGDNITSLDCNYNHNPNHYNNQLTTLDVSKSTALTYLNCSYNQLTSLDVSKNTALTYLNCVGNQLTSLDVSKNTALTYLSVGNQLTSLDVSKNTALTYLDCNSNQLTSLDVSKNTALIDLNCRYNQLTKLDVSKNTALMHLHCERNQLLSSALNTLFGTLHNNPPVVSLYSKVINIFGNPGANSCDISIATKKGWEVSY